MTVVKDDGLYRHLKFSDGSFNCAFDIITWPQYLTITGDCGTYTFTRVEDMFSFFRFGQRDKGVSDYELRINPGYWGEKLVSICRHGEFKKFDSDEFERRVTEYFHGFFGDKCDATKAECWIEIEGSVLSLSDNEHEAYDAVSDFSFDTPKGMNDFHFQDFFDGGGTEEYTLHYIWCLYAIAYGVQEYDKQK